MASFSQERLDLLGQCEKEVAATDPQSATGQECLTRYNVLFQTSVTQAGDLKALRQLEVFAPPNKSAERYLRERIKLAEAEEARKNTLYSYAEPRRRGDWQSPANLAEA